MSKKIDFIKKQKESFNKKYNYINIKSEDELADEILKYIDDDVMIEGFKEGGFFKKVRRAAKSAAQSVGDVLGKIDFGKEIIKPTDKAFKDIFKETEKAIQKMVSTMDKVFKDIEEVSKKTFEAVEKAINDALKAAFKATNGIHDVIAGFNDMEKSLFSDSPGSRSWFLQSTALAVP